MFGRVIPVLASLVLLGCEGRPHRAASGESDEGSPLEPHVAEFDLRGGVPEVGTASLLGGFSSASFADLVLELRQFEQPGMMRGAFVRFGSAPLGMARAEELGRLLAPLRAKVPVVCHSDEYGNATILAAAVGCTEVWLTPAGSVDAVGLAAQLVFARALFDKLGVKVDFMQEGRFKGAEEPFTRNEPSEPARATLEATLSAIRSAWLESTSRGRSVAVDALGLEDGPYTASEARDRKLVDGVGFEAEARARALELAGVKRRLVVFGGHGGEGGVGELVRNLSSGPGIGVPHVAVVRATGAIGMGGRGGIGGGDGITHRELAPLLRRLAADPMTRAVVLRIDSPGGSALASDLLWHEVRQLGKEKPVVASVGGMAASGGYYIASAATKIVAERSSIVGSIGVVMGKLAVGDALEQLGVHVTVVPAREGGESRATYESPFSTWDDATRAKLAGAMKSTYRLFLERIAEGRGVELSRVEPAAEGRIMGGEDARTRGLVDELGGLARAVELATSLAGADPRTPAALVRGGGGVLGLLRGDEDAESTRARLDREARAKALDLVLGPLGGARPAREDVEAFLGLLAPLAQGERALAVTPFVMSIR